MVSMRHAVALIVWALWAMPAATASAQADRDALARLRDISNLQVSVAFLPEVPTGGPCLLDRTALEERAAATLRAGGLEAVTGAETLRRAIAQLRLSQQDVRIMQEGGTLPAPGSAERRTRMNESEFLRNISALTVLFHATALDAGGTTVCAVAIAAWFSAIPVVNPTLAVNGRQVSARLLLWERQARSFVTREEELAGTVAERLDLVLDAFLKDWRLANGR
jgi:hypothetical protein